ncbi:MAG: hypothetical protein JXP36_05230, partial [Bacteroidales bacterium]|nr:hypothetical protein [Bacteroidales bacterium]
MKFITFLVFGLLLVVGVDAQKTAILVDENTNYMQAKELYDKQKYNTAQKLFQKVYEEHIDEISIIKTLSQYYIAQCAVNLFNADAEFLTFQFVSDNPNSPLVNDSYFYLGGYFYATKKWKDAIDTYEKVDWKKLDKEQKAELFFKKGYSFFMRDDLEEAKLAFFEIKDTKTKFTAPAIYYYSHIHYKEENYQ